MTRSARPTLMVAMGRGFFFTFIAVAAFITAIAIISIPNSNSWQPPATFAAAAIVSFAFGRLMLLLLANE